MPIPTISTLPPAPTRGQTEATFTSTANAFVAALPTLVTEINAVGDAMETTLTAAQLAETNAETAEANAELAAANAAAGVEAALAGYVSDAQTAEANAETAQAAAELAAVNAAGSANFKGTWASQVGAANKPYSVYHDGNHWNLLNNLADVTASEPGVTADWAQIGVGEAPNDGKQYVRKNETWAELVATGGLTPLTASGTLAVNTIYSVDANGDFTFVVPAGTTNGDSIKIKRNGFGGSNVFTGAFRNSETALIVKSWNYTLDLTWSSTRSLWIYE